MASVEWWQLSYRNLRHRTNIMLSKAQNSEIDVKMMQFLILICPTKAHTLVTKSKKPQPYRCFGKSELKELSQNWFLSLIKQETQVRQGAILRRLVAGEE